MTWLERSLGWLVGLSALCVPLALLVAACQERADLRELRDRQQKPDAAVAERVFSACMRAAPPSSAWHDIIAECERTAYRLSVADKH